MTTRKVLILAGLFLLNEACAVQADTTWTGGGDNLRWDSTLNWSNGLPSPDERAFINGSSTVLLDAAVGHQTIQRLILADNVGSDDVTLNLVSASLEVGGATNIEVGTIGKATLNISAGSNVSIAQHLRFGIDNLPTPQGVVLVEDSTLNIGFNIIMGPGDTSSLLQSLTIVDSTVTAGRLLASDGAHSRSLISMTGESQLTLNDLAVPTNFGAPDLQAHFQLDGGIVQVNNPSVGGIANQPSGFRLANGPAIFSSDPTAINTGTMDITGGVLRLVGDATALIQDYLNTNVLTAYGGTGEIVFDFDQTLAGFTTVAAVSGPSVPGDYNGNSVVDAADYVVWRKSFGQTGAGLAADGNGDSEVDELDYDYWTERFGEPSGPGFALGAAVPEPAALSMAIVALCFLGQFRRRTS